MKKLFVLIFVLFLVGCNWHSADNSGLSENVLMFPDDLDRAKTVCSKQEPASKIKLVEVISNDNCISRISAISCTLHVKVKVYCDDKSSVEYNIDHPDTTRRDLL